MSDFATILAAVGADLERRYNARGRHYHTLQHIQAMLRLCDEYERRLKDPDMVRVAIWFHDAVYSTRRPGNELRSAELALRQNKRLGSRCEAAAQLIRATERHSLDALDESLRGDASWFLDFDLAVLGQSPETYTEYAAAIRREYAWMPKRAFAEGRTKVLRAFLKRPQIYLTATLRRLWEKQARENLRNEIARLAAVIANMRVP